MPSTMPMSYIQGIEHKLISRVVYGTLNLDKSSEPLALLDSIYGSGCNAFDCAAIYGEGKCESILGSWIKQRQIAPEDIFLVTKGGCGDEANGWSPNLEPSTLETQIRGSLQRLGMSCVDLYMLHRDDPSTPVEQVVDLMTKFISLGLCKTWGVSNWETDRIDAAIDYANRTNQTPPVCDSLQMSLAEPHRAVWPGTSYMTKPREEWYTVSKGISVFAWETLAKGYMSGKWGNSPTVEAVEPGTTGKGDEEKDGWRQSNLEDAYVTPMNIERRERAKLMADSKGVSLAQIAVAYVLSSPIQPFVLIGTSSSTHWEANVKAATISLTAEEIKWLEDGGETHIHKMPSNDKPLLHCLSVEEMEMPSSKKRKCANAVPPAQEVHSLFNITDSVRDIVTAGRQSLLALAEGKDDRLMVLIGPCSVHDPKAAIEYAKWLLPLARLYQNELIVVMRVYFEKPRTTVGWKGLISDPNLDGTFNITKGLKLARALLLDCAELGLLTGTEFLAPNTCDYFADLVSYGAIGARTTESQCHREMASNLGMPVGFKNGTSGDVQVAADAIQAAKASNTFLGQSLDGAPSVITSTGNPGSHLILRGGKDGTNFDAKSVQAAHDKMKGSARIVVDCSHGNSSKKHKNQPIVAADIAQQIRDGNQTIMGVMIESNLVEGNQGLKPGNTDPSTLTYGQSVTDACIGLEDSEHTLQLLADAVKARRCL